MIASPGRGLLHPIAVASIGVLLLNDHVLKQHWGGVVTGKLSDFAGLLFFPLLLQGLWELARSLLGRGAAPSRSALVTAAVLTAVVFACVKVWPTATTAWSFSLGLMQWPFTAIASLVRGDAVLAPRAVQAVTDPTDLVALPSVGLAVAIGWNRAR